MDAKSKQDVKSGLARLPTADELAMLREVYAETYPVRPLLNEIERLTRERDEAKQYGSAVLLTRCGELEMANERLRAALEKYAQHWPTCTKVAARLQGREGGVCSCGLDDAARSANEGKSQEGDS